MAVQIDCERIGWSQLLVSYHLGVESSIIAHLLCSDVGSIWEKKSSSSSMDKAAVSVSMPCLGTTNASWTKKTFFTTTTRKIKLIVGFIRSEKPMEHTTCQD